MRSRLWIGFVVALALTAGAWLASEPVAAQAPAGAARGPAAIPRMPDGRPDLQGTFDVATITPLERNVEFGNRLVLTKAEAAALEDHEREWNDKSSADLSGDRAAPPVGGDTSTPTSFLSTLFRAGGGVVGGYNNFWLAGGTRVVTVEGQPRSSIVIDPPDGRIPAMKPDAKQRNAAYLARAVSPSANEGAASGPASAFDNPEQRPLAERCLLGFGSTSGPPTLPNYFYNNLKQIVQTRDTVMIFIEMVHDARIIRIGGSHLPPTVRRWMGDSVGRWEGDTLVVDTTNFTGKTQFQGSGENLHVVERFTRIDPNTIHYRFTVEDPGTWERPWSGEYTWHATSEGIYEYACHEGNQSLLNMMRGARFTEKQGTAAKEGNR